MRRADVVEALPNEVGLSADRPPPLPLGLTLPLQLAQLPPLPCRCSVAEGGGAGMIEGEGGAATSR